MGLIETFLVILIILVVGAFGIYHARKTRRLQKAYEKLEAEDKARIDSRAHLSPDVFAYAKPMSKSMWVSILIGVGIFIFILARKSGTL